MNSRTEDYRRVGRWRNLAFLLLSGMLALFAATPSKAQIYLEWTDKSLVGGVTATGYVGDVAIQSYQQGDARQGSAQINCSQITMSKSLDSASVSFLMKMFSGITTSADPTTKPVSLFFTQNQNGAPFAYYQINLWGVQVAAVTQSSGGSTPEESVSLNIDKFAWIQYNSSGVITKRLRFDCVAHTTF